MKITVLFIYHIVNSMSIKKNYIFDWHLKGKGQCPNNADITGWPAYLPNFFESQPKETLKS